MPSVKKGLLPEHQIEIDKAAALAVKVISEASIVAANKIAEAASKAHDVVADAAATSVKVLHLKSADDHDLLIELKTRMEGLKDDIKDIRDGTTKRICDLEENSAKKEDLGELQIRLEQLSNEVHTTREIRIRKLENKADRFWITVSLYSAFILGLAGIMIAHIFKTS